MIWRGPGQARRSFYRLRSCADGCCENFRTPHSASEWLNVLLGEEGEGGVLRRLMAVSDEEPKAMRRARTALEALQESARWPPPIRRSSVHDS